MTDTPTPTPAVLCSLCRMPWDEHERLAVIAARDAWNDRLDTHEVGSPPRDLAPAPITASMCVTLLLIDRAGPVGPQGMSGPMGLPGPACTHTPPSTPTV